MKRREFLSTLVRYGLSAGALSALPVGRLSAQELLPMLAIPIIDAHAHTYFDQFSLASELRDMGFKHVEDFGPEEANHRYFKDRADSLRISGSSHLMKACV